MFKTEDIIGDIIFISFNDIPNGIDQTMNSHNKINYPNLEDIKMATQWTENYIKRKIIL